MTFQKLRDDLPVTRHVDYFQVGSHGPTPDSVLDVVREEMALEAHYHSVPSVKAEQAGREAAARARVASFIGAGVDEVALTPNTTQAMRLVSRSIDWKDGDELLITSLEHVSTVTLGWGLERTAGVRVRVVEADQGDALFLESLKSALTDRTRLLCVSHVASPDGRILPVADAAELAHERGVRVVVDTAQSLGQFPVDVPALGCDFMAGSGHKWLLGPMGVGILWVSPDSLADFMPDPLPDRKPWSMPESPVPDPTAYDRAEGGTHNTAMAIGLGKAVEIVEELGTDAIAARVAGLSRTLRDGGVADRRRRRADPNHARPVGRNHHADVRRLFGRGPPAARGARLREAQRLGQVPMADRADGPGADRDAHIVACFNDEEEIGRLLDALREEVGRAGVR